MFYSEFQLFGRLKYLRICPPPASPRGFPWPLVNGCEENKFEHTLTLHCIL